MSQQADVYRLSEMKREGDSMFSFIKEKIQNQGEKIFVDSTLGDEVCGQNGINNDFYESSDGEAFYISSRDQQSNWFRFYRNPDTNIIEYQEKNQAPVALTGDTMYVPSFHIECQQKSDFSLPTVRFQFAVIYKNKSGNPVNLHPLIYQTFFRIGT